MDELVAHARAAMPHLPDLADQLNCLRYANNSLNDLTSGKLTCASVSCCCSVLSLWALCGNTVERRLEEQQVLIIDIFAP